MKTVCVFCGSSAGGRAAYREATEELAAVLAARSVDLVYGGGDVGLMGVLADAMLERGRKVIGVIPESLRQLEVAHGGLSELHVVHTMHERKALMSDRADAFVALPGGLGTLDELFEIMTWQQLGIHARPIGLLNVEGYFDALLGFLDHAVRERFLRAEHREIVMVERGANILVDRLLSFSPPVGRMKWIDRDER